MTNRPEFQDFVEAQDRCIDTVFAEISAGQKRTHWMWFIFPQLTALGTSPTAIRFGIADLDQAERYLAHPVLGSHLIEAIELMLGNVGQNSRDILGETDALKLRSSMTLFALLPDAPDAFRSVINTFYDDERCSKTLQILGLTC